MRKLIGLLSVIVVLAVVGTIADVVIRHRVQDAIAAQIDDQVPGAHASVSISSFPFVGRLATQGEVPKMSAHVTGVQAGPVALDVVNVVVNDVKVRRSELYHGTVQLTSIRQATVSAQISQGSIDAQVGLPITLGAGTVGLDGVQVPATLSVSGNTVHVQVPTLPAVSFTIPLTNLLPCIGSASLQPGQVTVACTTDKLPPVFDNVAASF